MDPKAPEKKERLLSALEKGMVMIHLDARCPGVVVPETLRGEWHLRLNISYRFDPPDLSVAEWGVRCTLSFGGARRTVAVPWSALFAITSQVSREFWMYPDDMPKELIELGSRTQAPPEGAPREDRPRAILRAVISQEPELPEPPAEHPQGEAPEQALEQVPEQVPEQALEQVPEQVPEEAPEEAPKPRGRAHLRVVK